MRWPSSRWQGVSGDPPMKPKPTAPNTLLYSSLSEYHLFFSGFFSPSLVNLHCYFFVFCQTKNQEQVRIHGAPAPSLARMAQKTVTFLAFGTRGDVLPLLSVAIAVARTEALACVFVTHQEFVLDYEDKASTKSLKFVSVNSTSSGIQVGDGNSALDGESAPLWPQRSHEREMCLKASEGACLLVANLFFLEAWSLAELRQIPCIFVSPFAQTERIPAELEVAIADAHESLYLTLKSADSSPHTLAGIRTVSWKTVEHFAWRMFLNDFGEWREDILGLDPIPFLRYFEETGVLPAACPLLYTLDSVLFPTRIDLPPLSEVVGFVSDNGLSGAIPAEIENFLGQSTQPPIFVGFGSMEKLGLVDAKDLIPTLLRTLRHLNARY